MDNQNYQMNNDNYRPLSLGEWLITLILAAIPCVNIIMLFIWGFRDGNESRKNYARAMLIFYAVAIVLYFIMGATLFSAIMSAI